ncbi:hypothetical protein QE152_g22741 [Popillia japonica]|uniref:Uncharacterized protein n=1 Tax=Popillia japonica TaxID=7064 RepID=A0AAW1KJE0_POPJA
MSNINYDYLWTRAIGPREVTQAALDKYGDKLKWKKDQADVLHDTCVDGHLTKNVIYPFIENHVKTMLGIDKWTEIIDFANQVNSTDKLGYKVFDIMDATDDEIDKMKHRFDHIFSIFVAEWLVPNI